MCHVRSSPLAPRDIVPHTPATDRPAAGTISATALPEAAYAAALASVSRIGPVRLRMLLEESSPPAAWERVLAGRDDDPAGEWRDQARGIDVGAVWDAHRRLGVDVLTLGDDRYPAALACDPEAPAVLFTLGDPSVVDRHPRVALVGTRSATRYGLGVAAQLGADLATAGVIVLSGLALGIDGAGHEGASAGWHAAPVAGAPPAGVVAGGLDVPYPRSHALLWQRVAEAGVLLSESPVGAVVPRWRFPQRNRILAALADVVVVVECHTRGGSLHTVRAAISRGVSVGAVPGSVRSPASSGTNDLLADGCFVVRDATDVMVAVGLARAGSVPVRSRRRREAGRTGSPPPSPPPPSAVGTLISAAVVGAGSSGHSRDATAEPLISTPRTGTPEASVLEAIDWEPCSVEQLMRRTGLPLATVSVSLERLRQEGRIRGDAGWWGRT